MILGETACKKGDNNYRANGAKSKSKYQQCDHLCRVATSPVRSPVAGFTQVLLTGGI